MESDTADFVRLTGSATSLKHIWFGESKPRRAAQLAAKKHENGSLGMLEALSYYRLTERSPVVLMVSVCIFVALLQYLVRIYLYSQGITMVIGGSNRIPLLMVAAGGLATYLFFWRRTKSEYVSFTAVAVYTGIAVLVQNLLPIR